MSTERKSILLKKIFIEYHSQLCTYIYRYVADHDVAKDIVQEVFLDVWTKIDMLDFSYSIRPLLYRYAHNKAMDYLKSSPYKNCQSLNINSLHPDGYISYTLTGDLNDEINLNELSQTVQECIDKLPPQCKKIYSMSRADGLKNREISDVLHISVKAIEKQIAKALHKIKKNLLDNGFIVLLTALIIEFV